MRRNSRSSIIGRMELKKKKGPTKPKAIDLCAAAAIKQGPLDNCTYERHKEVSITATIISCSFHIHALCVYIGIET